MSTTPGAARTKEGTDAASDHRGESVLAAFSRFVLDLGGLLASTEPDPGTRLEEITRIITGSPALLAREREILNEYTHSLAALIPQEGGAAADDPTAWVAANALMGGAGRKQGVSERTEVTFASGGDSCSAWHYPGSNGACVVMATGAAITKEPGADRFAARFQAAGFTVLFLRLSPLWCERRNISPGAATARAGGRPQSRDCLRRGPVRRGCRSDRGLGLLPRRGLHPRSRKRSEARGRHRSNTVRRWPRGRAQCAETRTARVMLTFPFIALGDALGGLIGRPPRLIPLTGRRGSIAMLTTPDAQDGPRALDPDGRYSDWLQVIAARSVMQMGFYRPGRRASRITCPLLVIAAEDDESVLAAPAARVASEAANSELLRIPGGHYAPVLEQHEVVVSAEAAFLNQHLDPAHG